MAYRIDPGELTEELELYSMAAGTRDSVGQKPLTPTLQDTVWAKRVPMRAAERFSAAQTREDVWERFVIRARADVSTTWTIKWKSGDGTPSFDIVAVTPLPGRAWLELIGRRGVKDAR